jgi:hypothetical protein
MGLPDRGAAVADLAEALLAIIDAHIDDPAPARRNDHG